MTGQSTSNSLKVLSGSNPSFWYQSVSQDYGSEPGPWHSHGKSFIED